MNKILVVTMSFALLIAACSKTESAAQTETSATSAKAAVPASEPMSAPQQAALISGKILETMDAAGYTYVKLDTDKGQVWAAVNQTKVEKGKDFALVPNMVMENFESKTLNRKFDKIVFGTLPGAAPAGGAPMMGGMPTAMPAGMDNPHAKVGQPAKDPGPIKVDKAPGGKTVSELWASRSSMGGKNVAIRGKVVKFLPGIMGKNWIHLRDGSGTPEKGDHDITVTTSETAAVGDVVTVNGLVKVDQDLGAGYKYPVIIEDAKIVR